MAKKNGFFHEFKEFISRGNVLDLAVGVIVGGAFSTITTSLTNDVIMPIVSIFLGGVDFSSMKLTLPNLFGTLDENGNLAVNTLNYGNFLASIINFLILAFVVFLIVKSFNKMRQAADAKRKKEEEEAPAEPAAPPAPTAEELLCEIRDLLKEQNSHE